MHDKVQNDENVQKESFGFCGGGHFHFFFPGVLLSGFGCSLLLSLLPFL